MVRQDKTQVWITILIWIITTPILLLRGLFRLSTQILLSGVKKLLLLGFIAVTIYFLAKIYF